MISPERRLGPRLVQIYVSRRPAGTTAQMKGMCTRLNGRRDQLITGGAERAICSQIPTCIGIFERHMIGSQVIDLKAAAPIMVCQEDGIVSTLLCQIAVDANIHECIGAYRGMHMRIRLVPLPACLCSRRQLEGCYDQAHQYDQKNTEPERILWSELVSLR